ncbi:hypothetical protein [Arthrobacter sp. ZGTC131]|uniref:hypothetical protein n=1 Tax=Arthrobacter sp. ZGTC131 TaxID=2058898 RepID=UPI0015E3B355|nr:hypothetical protein [Arthrobacter sp. ZGTC131]
MAGSIAEIMIAAAETGAAMHHCHVNSTQLRRLLEFFRRRSGQHGIDFSHDAPSPVVQAHVLAPCQLDPVFST